MHKNIRINLGKTSGNALEILEAVYGQSRKQGLSQESWERFYEKAISRDFVYTIAVILETFDVRFV